MTLPFVPFRIAPVYSRKVIRNQMLQGSMQKAQKTAISSSRPNISQLRSLKISRSAFLENKELTDSLNLALKSCETFGQIPRVFFASNNGVAINKANL